MSTQMEQDLQHLRAQSRGAGLGPEGASEAQPNHPSLLMAPPGPEPRPDLAPRIGLQAHSPPHLELHAARAAVQTVQKVLQQALAVAQGLVGDFWEALS